MKKIINFAIATTIIFSGTVTIAPSQTDAATGIYKNCTAFNKHYPKGVAKSANTKNKVVSRKSKQTTYKSMSSGTKISSEIYKKAIKNNYDLDRDNDGIACER
ncbi:excalibur calcium-binding domain-containing protein [Viridibacillus arvi]|uniref:excalibur calcium-binding domain-containing protein n=1 Tax=Viridibacillus arvi TaxID=263475 RepID=UPI0036A78851